jgi:hypothetical protein
MTIKVPIALVAVAVFSLALANAHETRSDAGCGSYINRSGHVVARPCSSPNGATARCADGTYSYSEHPNYWLTCSYHGGVVR